MRKFVLVLAVALSLCTAACSKSPKDRLQGKWLGDSISNISPEHNAEVASWVKGTSLEFTGERMTVTVPAEQPRSGQFKVAKVEGKKVTVAVTREGGADTTLLVLNDDATSLQWDVGEGRQITMTRLK
jgi:endonuclease YncB( thermonuclease family)